MIGDDSRISRRQAVGGLAGLAAASVLRDVAQAQTAAEPARAPGDERAVMCLFSKPLHNRSFRELPDTLHEAGIDAVDLTCRAGGHVLPDRVEDDLPAAVESLRQAGVSVPMITTEITDADKDHAEEIVKTVASLGIRYAKLGYYKYGDLRRLQATLADVKARLRDLAVLFKAHGVQAGFHNHSGSTVGAAMWDVWDLIRELPAAAIGSYFDVRHATTEGGDAGWRIGMHLLAPRIVMVAVKDFLWQRHAKRGWYAENVALGEGMVRIEEWLRLLKEMRFAGPISLHMEYMAGGEHVPATGSDADTANLESIRKDWRFLGDMLAKVKLTNVQV